MKKLMLIMLLAALTCAATAQTNFRDLSYAEALQTAKTENKMLFMDFYTSWCGPCKMMAKEVFPQEKVGNFLNDRFVCIKIDAEKGEGVELARRYKVDAYPTFIGVNVNEKEMLRIVGYEYPDAFISKIDRLLDPDKTPERMQERYEEGERTPDLIRAYAALKLEESFMGTKKDKLEEASRIVKDYFNELDETARLAPENLFIYIQHVFAPTDEITRYMVEHRGDFAPELQLELNARFPLLYDMYMMDYFSGSTSFSSSDYEQAKKDIVVLGLNQDKHLNLIFKFIECYESGNLNAYLSLCEKEFKHLNENAQNSLLMALPTLVDTDDQKILKHAVEFVRHALPWMTTTQIYLSSSTLRDIESKIK